MDDVGIPSSKDLDPLYNHDTPNPTHHTCTLKHEEQNMGVKVWSHLLLQANKPMSNQKIIASEDWYSSTRD